ncbi:P-loop containing nucleoside triphosphate hydrolase protein [Achaetomium macrosporum]|uniref:DNA 3'-5' helicase n=1 Tax=Achaetomium macrosporum TaxID=79813 RepID=A0AAN7C2D3_9PEZI|nr:P-loop containing nucleoside triphosphate hydrolase protein [Achaetomium macrosporum]
MEAHDQFDRVKVTICAITGAQMPRLGQIEAVARLVYDPADTVLVAATGYGKSAVLYAFSALADRITVQIVPLTKLGENQRDDRNVPNSRPVWVDADTHLKNPRVWGDIQAGEYTHVLLSPEQALHPKFKAVLKDPGFHTRIGLFAIDELHCVSKWREFREDYTYLHTLRVLLPRRIPWFGCTATLDRDNQNYILEKAGFEPSKLKIIRTSVDRPEISIVVQPLLRGALRDHRRLHFLLEGATAQTIRKIPKTIIYVDSKPQLIAARYTLIRYLRKRCGILKTLGRKVVRRYDADVRPVDKDMIYKEFADHDTDCRIIVATVSLGMGMDLPDVERVVQFGLPPAPTLSDIWQRFRRAMRKKEGQGTAYLFAPYWAFDHLGSVEGQPKQKKPLKPKPGGKRAPVRSSGLRQMVLAERDDDEVGSQASDFSGLPVVNTDLTLADPNLAHSQNLFDCAKKVKWSKSDLNQREKLGPVVMGFLNAPCFRKYVLDYLQEPDDPDLEYKRPVTPEKCCNACNHSLGPVPSLPPRDRGPEKPAAGSLAGVALEHLRAWCKVQAQNLVPASRRRFDIIPEMWLSATSQYQIARVFSSGRGKRQLPFHNIQGLVENVPDLKNWRHLQAKGADLATFCVSSVDKIHDAWAASKASKGQGQGRTTRTTAAEASRKRAAESAAATPPAKR